MSLSEIFSPPNPDGAGTGVSAESTPRAAALLVDPSLGGATRTGADNQGTLELLLSNVGGAVQKATLDTLSGTATGQKIISQAKAQYLQQQWQQWAPLIVVALIGAVVLMWFGRR